MIKNIIFDLGGVILDVDFKKTLDAFSALGIDFPQIAKPDFWEGLNQLGSYSLNDFASSIRRQTNTEITNQEIELAWTVLLGDFKAQRMTLLEKLSQNYSLYLFSNTDAIHTKTFEEKCRLQTGHELGDYFVQTFYSQNIKIRKPNLSAFQKVIQLANIKPEETLFIDDKLENVEAARKAGLYAYHHQTELAQLDIATIIKNL